MAEDKMMRLSQVARELNVGTSTIAEHLVAKGFEVENKPNSKITPEQFEMLSKAFKSSALEKREASGLTIGKKHSDNMIIDADSPFDRKHRHDDEDIFVKPEPAKEPVFTPPPVISEKPVEKPAEDPIISANRIPGLKVVGKIDLNSRATATPVEEKKPQPVMEEKKPIPVVEEPKSVLSMEEKKPEPIPEKKPIPQVEIPQAVTQPEEKPVKVEQTVKQPEPEPEKATLTPIEPQPIAVKSEPVVEEKITKKAEPESPKKVDVIPPINISPTTAQPPKTEDPEPVQEELIEAKAETLKGLTVLGKIELPLDRNKKKPNPVASSDDKDKKKSKRKRKRVRIGEQGAPTNAAPANTNSRPILPAAGARSATGNTGANSGGSRDNTNRPAPNAAGNPANRQQTPFNKAKRPTTGTGTPATAGGANRFAPRPFEKKEEVSDKQIQDQIKATLAKLSGGNRPNTGAKMRQEKRRNRAEEKEARMLQEQEEAKTLKVTEFISANDLASLMDVSVNEVISVCLGLGMFVSINQRLDAEAITVITDEFGYDVDFTSAEEEADVILDGEDSEEDLEHRAPIVTIMGHVDHGKTSLLDYIRRSKVTAGEAGGITQHIGAYDVKTDTGKRIAFLDTPGHEAFTAMRARGAKVTDIVIIVVAADDNVMPQTKEAINHAQVAGVPIVIAINKVDKPSANPEKIKEELAKENILVESWGGKYQSEEISAKTGKGIPELLEKVLLEAELLDLKANAKKNAVGTVIEASLDKGRGYVTTVLVQSGTLKVGDIMLAGAHHGRVKAMTDHRGRRLKEAGPSTPVQVLGLSGAPQAGDKFNVVETEREARELSNKREQILREQNLRTRKHITLEEIGRRKAIGTFKELNVVIKGDVDGSIEALSDSLLRLSTDEVQVRIIHKAVGQISESDVLLASAADAVIVGFQVRPSTSARKLADQEEIEIRLYSIIYDAINDVKDAMEGMLAPKLEEIIVGTIEVRDVFKITKVGTVAGCYVTDGYFKRNNKVRVIRDGIVVHTGDIDALKRFKDDVSEVKYGYECGLSIKGLNDIEVGDTIESFEQKETKRTL